MKDTESNHATFLFFCAMKADHNEGLNSASWLGKNCDKSRLKDILGVIEELVYSDGSLRGKEGALISKVKTIWGI